ncbi:NAD-dependent protein deacetylase sirtuin-2-like [Planococcus citri]|uniref:NAD-dependent protein deacetylase sirtuin-2-like n=1 Tax=Planococcus citri TaxID=170843 RepID=UPI0031F755A0
MKINNKVLLDYLFSWRRKFSGVNTLFRVIKSPNETIKPRRRRTHFSCSTMEHPNEEFDEDLISSLPTNDSLEEEDEGSFSGSPSDVEPDGSIESVRRFFAETLGLGLLGNLVKEKPAPPIVLDEANLDGIVKFINSEKCKHIITMAGAGISTSAGIPDFRSPGSGLYDNLQKYNLPYPQAIFEINFFRENPKPFFVLAKELYPGTFKPTVGHYFIRLLQEKGYLLRHYTQNIDTLERVAGLSPDKLVEAHGSFHTSHCLDCSAVYEQEWMKEKIFTDEIPICKHCGGIVKPDIVFFGENLPAPFFMNSQEDFPKCDLLIIMGSSLVVQPFASLKDRVREDCPRLLINRELVGQNDLLRSLGLSNGLDFDPEHGTRDVFWEGMCDDGCQLLADKLGWGDELRQLVKQEHERISGTSG